MENQQLQRLNALSPIDGRYQSRAGVLIPYFSEAALIRYRVQVEVEYFIALCELPLPQLTDFDQSRFDTLRKLYLAFGEADALRVKEIEKETNHDVKAVEYFLKEKFDAFGLSGYKEFIHFGLTSQDINNTAIPLSIKEAMETVYLPLITQLADKLQGLSEQWADIPMLARTHGQPASPTRLGKEIAVFTARLQAQLSALKNCKHAAKFGGATGNFNAHHAAYPDTDWPGFAKNFVREKLGLHYSFPTTQIEHYDHLAGLFDALKRINTIILDLSRDLWLYIMMDYFKQTIKKGEVGSSAMPHKVNPIDFENAEGNLGMANAIFSHLAAKLPLSRLQRDLTDSTVLRNTGVPLAHTVIAIQSVLKGLGRLTVNQDKIAADLEENTAVIAEGIQTILRREGYPNPYEALKDLTRTGKKISRASIADFIDSLSTSPEVKEELKALSPQNYTGV